MVIDTRTFRSTVKPTVIKAALIKGTLIAVAGILLMTVAALFLSSALLARLGIPLFLFCMSLIAIGLLPHRKLLRLEKKPHEIIIIGEIEIQCWSDGKKILTIPQQKIESLSYIEMKTVYGICVKLDPNCPEKVMMYDPSGRKWISKENCDVFFPFFSERVCKQIKDLLTLSPEIPER